MSFCLYCHEPTNNALGFCSTNCYEQHQTENTVFDEDDVLDLELDDEIICLKCGPEMCDECKRLSEQRYAPNDMLMFFDTPF